jgi:hypothetical protein
MEHRGWLSEFLIGSLLFGPCLNKEPALTSLLDGYMFLLHITDFMDACEADAECGICSLIRAAFEGKCEGVILDGVEGDGACRDLARDDVDGDD